MILKGIRRFTRISNSDRKAAREGEGERREYE